MSGAYGGFQKFIHEKQPLAFYVHCPAHNLNLVVNDAVSGVCEVQDCFSTVHELHAFFGHSICRWDLMASITGESAVTLKKLNSIRWAGRLSWLLGIKHRYWDHWDVMKALQGSHCFGEQEVLSVVMHWSSRSCCRRLSLCWFLFCWQKYYQHCFSSSAVERCWS